MHILTEPVLTARGLRAGYGGREVVRDVSMNLLPGELVAVIGHNGAGKSTLLKAIFGVVELMDGTISLDGSPMAPSPVTLVRRGLSFAPQGNRIFPSLTVLENLRLAFAPLAGARRFETALDQTLEPFPDIGGSLQRDAGALSGGVRQILALAMAMIVAPRVLLLDEPCLGLAPPLVKPTLDRIKEICATRQIGALVVEQRVRQVLDVADRAYVLRGGAVSFAGAAATLREGAVLKTVFL